MEKGFPQDGHDVVVTQRVWNSGSSRRVARQSLFFSLLYILVRMEKGFPQDGHAVVVTKRAWNSGSSRRVARQSHHSFNTFKIQLFSVSLTLPSASPFHIDFLLIHVV
jgi:3-isopropylmalate dehydratase small subunit